MREVVDPHDSHNFLDFQHIFLRERSYTEALKYYEQALNEPPPGLALHEIHASMANIWRYGGYGVEKDPSYAGELYTTAAEAAMSCGKGKLSSKYFMIAEEAWGEVEEE